MPLTKLEHFLVQTTNFQATCDWYEHVLGLTRGYTPDFRFPVQWMYLDGHDVLHITQGGTNVSENRMRYNGQESQADFGSGVVDHIAFRCHGLPETIAHLRSRAIEFRQRMVNDQGLYQLFLIDPNGVKIELNFANAEAIENGIVPELMASDLPA